MTTDLTKRKLWQLTAELEGVHTAIEEAGGELTEGIEQQLDALTIAFDEKVEGIGLMVREFEVRSAAAEMEERRLRAIRTASANAAANLKRYVQHCMTAAEIKRVQTPRGTVRIQKNSQPAVHTNRPLTELPDRFVQVEEVYSLDRKAILEAWKAGETLPDGIIVERGEHLRIQ